MHRSSGFLRRLAICCPFVALAAAPLAAHAASLAPAAFATGHSDAIAAAPRVAGVRDTGRAPAQTVVRLAIALKAHRPAMLESLVREVSDPSSRLYRRFLTPRQFADAFAPTPEEYTQYAMALQRLGLTVTRTYPTRTMIDVAAPAATVERTFATELHSVEQPGAGRRYANVRPAYLPVELRPQTAAVVGFDNLVGKINTVRGNRVRRNAALRPPIEGPDFGFAPYALATAYNFPVQRPITAAGAATYDGTGHAAAIVIDSDVRDTDLTSFLAYFNIVRSGPALARVPIDGGAAVGNDVYEATLDAETVSSLAPGAAISLYLTPDLSSTSVTDAYAHAVNSDSVDVVDSGFSFCEYDYLGTMADVLATQGAALGITFVAASGDSGSRIPMCDDGFGDVGTSSPADAPHFVGVGGTSLLVNDDGSYLAELAWNQSGGGPSVIFPTPAYQAGINGVPCCGRSVPDIAFIADPGASLYVYNAFEGPMGGTSLGSAMFTALMTEINQFRGGRSGFVNPALYAIVRRTGYTRFHDVVYGNNGYAAGPGYDPVTGIGSPIGWPL